MVNSNTHYLFGRLELVELFEKFNGEFNKARGRIVRDPDKTVLVNNVGMNAGNRCLVKFSSDPRNHHGHFEVPLGSFITSTILDPEDAEKGFAYSDYVLFGFWSPRMTCPGRYPTCRDLNRYYDPGDMHRYWFIPGHTPEREVFVMKNRFDENSIRLNGLSDNGKLDIMLDKITHVDHRTSRVIVSDLMDPLMDYSRRVLGRGITPVYMDPVG